MKKLLIGVAIILAAAGLYFLLVQKSVPTTNPQTSTISTTTPSASPLVFSDPYFAEVAQKLGLQGEGLRIFHQANPIFSSDYHYQFYAQNAEYYNGQIKLHPELKGKLDPATLSIVAHEYLHAVWDQKVKTNPETMATLVPALNELYVRYSLESTPRFAEYRQKGQDVTIEQHSIFGSEMKDDQLPAVLRDWYIQWIPNRAVLPAKCC